MLILSRREGESVSIIIDGKAVGRVTLVTAKYSKKKSGKGARIGFEFPKEIGVIRDNAKATEIKD